MADLRLKVIRTVNCFIHAYNTLIYNIYILFILSKYGFNRVVSNLENKILL